jgi:hypothetical protein
MKEQLKEAIDIIAQTFQLIVDDPTIVKNAAALCAKMRVELMEQGFTRTEAMQIITATTSKGIARNN